MRDDLRIYTKDLVLEGISSVDYSEVKLDIARCDVRGQLEAIGDLTQNRPAVVSRLARALSRLAVAMRRNMDEVAAFDEMLNELRLQWGDEIIKDLHAEVVAEHSVFEGGGE